MSEPWGWHLMVDAAECDHDKITDAENVRSFARELVEAIDMVAYGEPQVVGFGSGNKAGFTLVQLIETSNICCHFCDETDTLYLDIFSCKWFDEDVAVEVARRYFGFKRAQTRVQEREA